MNLISGNNGKRKVDYKNKHKCSVRKNPLFATQMHWV